MKTITQLLCLLAFVCFANTTQAQTKEETVKWLTEKMLSPNFFYIDANKQKKVKSVKLDDNFLIINYTFSTYYRNKWGEQENVYQRSISINLVHLILENLPRFSTNGNNIYYQQKKQSITLIWEKQIY